ncbi:MAG: hypothetical protein RIK87_02065 [Fuerstiella sp.]
MTDFQDGTDKSRDSKNHIQGIEHPQADDHNIRYVKFPEGTFVGRVFQVRHPQKRPHSQRPWPAGIPDSCVPVSFVFPPEVLKMPGDLHLFEEFRAIGTLRKIGHR